MAVVTRATTTELTNHYVKLWEARYGGKSGINRFAAHWNFTSVLEHISKKQVKELLDYYFTCHSGKRHDLEWFFWNYDKLITGLTTLQKDREHRDILMAESRERVEKWKARTNGNKGTTNP